MNRSRRKNASPPRAKPSPEVQNRLYARLLAREPDAPADFIETFLEPLLNALQPKGAEFGLPDPTLVDEVVENTLLRFPQEPEKFDTKRGKSLWFYLYMDALGDLKNEADKERRKRRGLHLVSLDAPIGSDEEGETVADRIPDRNEGPEDVFIRRASPPSYLPEGVNWERVGAEVAAIVASPIDQQIVELILAGVRQTERYAEVLGITYLPANEQRRRVKQEKDKWRLRLKRLGAKLDDHPS